MFKNLDEWTSKLTDAVSGLEDKLDSAADGIEEHLIKETDRFTPTDTRNMINSRRVDQDLGEDSLEITVSYNENGNAPYAIEQHENPYYDHGQDRHPNNPPEAQYKFLERPLVFERETWIKILKDGVKWK